jgi:hypothetical protein
MSDLLHYNEYRPVKLDIPIEMTGMEYFGPEQNQIDLKDIVADKANPLQVLGKFVGTWDGELDNAIKTAIKVRYADRVEHKDYLYEVYDFSKFPIIEKMPEALGFVKGKYKAQIQLQRPGCIMPRHVDPETMFTMYGKEKNSCVRVLIMLAPWEYGQLMFFNNFIWKEWEAGDIIYCDFTKTNHFTANCSWHSRPILQITGVASENLQELIRNKQSKIIKL